MKINDTIDRLDKTNRESGIYQARAALEQVFQDSYYLDTKRAYEAVVLYREEVYPPEASSAMAREIIGYPYAALGAPGIQYYKIYFRIPSLHKFLPLPSSFKEALVSNKLGLQAMPTSEKEASERGLSNEFYSLMNTTKSKLTTSALDDLLIKSHPHIVVSEKDLEAASNILPDPMDTIEIRFTTPNYTAASFVGFLEKGPNAVFYKKSPSGDIVMAPKSLADYDTLNFKKIYKEKVKACHGSEDGSLARLASEIGFEDPYILVAIRKKESNGDPQAVRFEPNLFLSSGRPGNGNELRHIPKNWETYGYKLKTIYINVDGKARKYFTYEPSDSNYDPLSGESYSSYIKPIMDNPNGAVMRSGGIKYLLPDTFYNFRGSTQQLIGGKSVVVWDPSDKWDDKLIAQGSSGTNQSAFMNAYKLDPARAIKSTSFGMYQVMGWALLRANDESPTKALDAFLTDPLHASETTLKGFFSRADKQKVIPLMNQESPPSDASWTAFAKAYNGPKCCGMKGSGFLLTEEELSRKGQKKYDVDIKKKYEAALKECDINLDTSETLHPYDDPYATVPLM